jgi:ketosteroid isomerase-like protein
MSSTKRAALFAAVICALAAPAFAAEPSAGLKAELLKLEADWNQAVVDRDVARLDQILGPDFVLIWTNGGRTDRASLLAGAKARRADILPFVTEDVSVRVYGDTAVLTGKFTQTAKLGDQSETGTFWYTDVYVKKDGRWQAVAAQATRVRP